MLSKKVTVKKGNNKITFKVSKKREKYLSETVKRLPWYKRFGWEFKFIKELVKWRMTFKTKK